MVGGRVEQAAAHDAPAEHLCRCFHRCCEVRILPKLLIIAHPVVFFAVGRR